MKTLTNIICAAIALSAFAYFGLMPTPNAFGVVPAPDGGYPGGNTAEGQNALLSLTSGAYNTSIGFLSLESATAAVTRDENGRVNSVRYNAVNAMLLNEFLKEHKRVEEQQQTIAQMAKEMQIVIAQLKEQAAQIQKVSAKVQMSKPSPEVVTANR
jgi:hypothetical protein